MFKLYLSNKVFNYHKLHFSAGFMRDPMGQLNALENSRLLVIVPRTLWNDLELGTCCIGKYLIGGGLWTPDDSRRIWVRLLATSHQSYIIIQSHKIVFVIWHIPCFTKQEVNLKVWKVLFSITHLSSTNEKELVRVIWQARKIEVNHSCLLHTILVGLRERYYIKLQWEVNIIYLICSHQPSIICYIFTKCPVSINL